jgi:Tol biopolymer transport system component
VPVGGGDAVPIVAGPDNDIAPAISPDGTLVAFSRSPSANVAGAFRNDLPRTASDLYVVPIEGGEPTLVATGLWPGALWAPDGSRLAAWSVDWQQLVVVSLDEATPSVHIPTPDNLAGAFWQPIAP